MASFTVTSPKELDSTKITIQDTSPDFLHSTKSFSASSPGSQTFTATALIQSQNYATGATLTLAQPEEMVNIELRPTIGQIYPRMV